MDTPFPSGGPGGAGSGSGSASGNSASGTAGSTLSPKHTETVEAGTADGAGSAGGRKRVFLPGSSAKSIDDWSPVALADMGGPLSVQQYIQQSIKQAGRQISVSKSLQCPPDQDAGLWQYEQLRQLTQDLNTLTTRLQPVCNRTTCPVMQAMKDVQYLCAAHKTPRDCCAIDYMVHTLDGTMVLLNSMKLFPSRVCVPAPAGGYFQSISRRIYRILSHAYFHHREVFDQVEESLRLCERFTKFALMYKLMPRDQLLVPETAFRPSAVPDN